MTVLWVNNNNNNDTGYVYKSKSGTVPVLAGITRTNRKLFRKYFSSVIGKQDIKILQNRAISEEENVLRIVLK
jgi:hypothetical protein